MSESKSGSSGVGISTVVFIVFVVLKLLDVEPVASWSWWWVTSPLWIVFGIVAAILAVIGSLMLVSVVTKSFGRRGRMDRVAKGED